MTASEVRDPSRDKLRPDINAVQGHAEVYPFASIGHVGEPYAAARSKPQRTLDTAKAQVKQSQQALVARTQVRLRGGPIVKRTRIHRNSSPECHCGHAHTIADCPPLNAPETAVCIPEASPRGCVRR